MHVRLIGCSVLAGSFTTEYSSGPRPAFTTREDAQLLKTVLQDSINLLEQVGGGVHAADGETSDSGSN